MRPKLDLACSRWPQRGRQVRSGVPEALARVQGQIRRGREATDPASAASATAPAPHPAAALLRYPASALC